MSDCVAAMKAAVRAGSLTDTQAKDILNRMENRAKARKLAKNISDADALKEIAGEMQAATHSALLIDRRNRLLSLQALRTKLDAISASKNWGGALKEHLIKTLENIKGLQKDFSAPLANYMADHDLTSDVMNGRHGLEAYQEMRNVERGGTAPATTVMGDKLFKLFKFYKAMRDEHVAKINTLGGYINTPDKPYGFLQSWDSNRVRALGGKGSGGAHKDAARQAFMQHVSTWNVHPDTFAGGDPKLFWNHVFENLYNGSHETMPHAIDIDKFEGVHGSEANKVSESRLIWFADADSQFRAMQAFGGGHYGELMIRQLESAGRTVGMMQDWGPNWKNTQDVLRSTLEAMAGETDAQGVGIRADSAKQIDSLKGFDLDGYQRLLSGEADRSLNPTMTQRFKNIIGWTHLSKGGGFTISSASDVVQVNNQMAQHGIAAMDTASATLRGFTPDTPDGSRILRGMNVVSHGFAGALNGRFGLDRFSGTLNKASHILGEMNGFRKWNDNLQEVMGQLMAWNLGEHSHLDHASLPDLLRNKLERYSIGPLEWEAYRSIAAEVPELDGGMPVGGDKYVLMDQLPKISDAAIDAIVVAKGLNATAPNRARARIELETHLGAFFNNEIEQGLSVPNLEAKYYLTGGARQAGTIPREVMNLFAVFKAFPVMTALNFARRARENGIERVFSLDWFKRENLGYTSQQAMYVAMSAFAGYMSLTAKDILAGKTPKRIIDDEGNPNASVFLAALGKANGLGIWADMLFGEYDRQYKNVLNGIAGPVFGQAAPLFGIATSLRDAALGAPMDRSIKGQVFDLVKQNLPFGNLPYIAPILNAMVFNSMREALSPGVLRREEKRVRDQKVQDYWLEPSSTVNFSQ